MVSESTRRTISTRLGDERGRIVKGAPLTVVLAYPSPYQVAMSSLGYQRIYRALQELPKIEQLFGRCSRMMQTITALPQPVIARVQGAAAAAGCQLVAQCDLAVASEAARFTTPGVTWGFFCSTPGVAVGRNISRKRAMEMLLTGELIDAHKALEWGLVNRVVAAASLEEETQKLARQIAEKPPATTAAGKRAFYQQMDLGIAKAYDLASQVISSSFAHAEGREGMDAFIDKRPPPKH